MASALYSNGASKPQMMRAGQWASPRTVDRYIVESASDKRHTNNLLMGSSLVVKSNNDPFEKKEPKSQDQEKTRKE